MDGLMQLLATTVGGFLAYGGLFIQNRNEIKKERYRFINRKIEKAFTLNEKLLTEVNLFLKSQKDFCSDPDKYLNRAHHEGEWFTNFDEYYDYCSRKFTDFFQADFFEDFATVKIIVSLYLPKSCGTVNEIENKILEIKPMIEFALQENEDFLEKVYSHVDMIYGDLKKLSQILIESNR